MLEVETAVIRPFASTVMTGTSEAEPNDPTLELTEAKVSAAEPAVDVTSPPENAGKTAAGIVPVARLDALVP